MSVLDVTLLFLAHALIGWLLADLVGGVVHWIEDRVLDGDVHPLIERLIVAPNRDHHLRPNAFVDGGLVARNGTTWLAAGLIAAIWLACLGPSVIWAFATIGGLVTSQVHWLAHQPKRGGPLVRIAQDIGLLQSVAHHAGHHRPPSDRRYCVLTGWLNPILDGIGVWARLERGLKIRG